MSEVSTTETAVNDGVIDCDIHPAIRSFDSVNGPSRTKRCAPARRTRVPAVLGLRP